MPFSDHVLQLHLQRSKIEFNAQTDSLGDLASLFIFHLFQCHDEVYDVRKYELDTFIIHILRRMRLHDDVLFGALMFLQRVRFRAPKFILKHSHIRKAFISAYILSAKQFAREADTVTTRSLEDYTQWSDATQGLYDENKIRNMEWATLKVLQEDRAKGIQADTAFDGLLAKFRDTLVGDYEDKLDLRSYPQSLATARPIFMVHESIGDSSML